LAAASEAALERLIRELYLTPQKLTAAQVVREIIGRCGAEKLPIPLASTVQRDALLGAGVKASTSTRTTLRASATAGRGWMRA
jgi:hypothetical protein